MYNNNINSDITENLIKLSKPLRNPNHFLYMDVLKLYGNSQAETES